MTTLASLKTTLTATDADWVLEALIARTVDFVERQLDWYFREPRDAVEVLDGTGLRALWLRQYIAEETATSPLVEYRTGVGGDWTELDADEYEYSVGQRALFNTWIWTRGVQNYRVSYREGFTTMPGDIEQLVLDLIVAKWNARGRDPLLKSETLDYYSYTRGDLEEIPGWKEIRARWKRGRI